MSALSDTDTLESLEARVRIKDNMNAHLNTYSGKNGLFFYAPRMEFMVMCYSGNETYQDRAMVRSYMEENYPKGREVSFPEVTSWFPVKLGEQVFLLQIAEYKDVIIGSWYRAQDSFRPLRTLVESTQGQLFLGAPENPEDAYFPVFAAEEAKSHPADGFSEDYVKTRISSNRGDFALVLYLSRKAIIKDLFQFTALFYLALILGMVFLVVSFLALWKQLIQPVHVLIRGMQSLQEGELDTQLPLPAANDEFALMTRSFNRMAGEIRNLKLQIYEERLLKANTELEYLTLQIKPHFFLNALNVIYSLGLSRKYELITELTTCLMKYFRYLFKSSDAMVPVKEELEHAGNYLRIQELRYRKRFQVEAQISEEGQRTLIPVLCIQTFIENAFKHAYTDERELSVRVAVEPRMRQGQKYLSILIEDNGRGFTQEQLMQLNEPLTGEAFDIQGKHIGIRNVKRRLQFLYGDRYKLVFSNLEDEREAPGSRGAAVYLLLPRMREMKDGEGIDEAFISR